MRLGAEVRFIDLPYGERLAAAQGRPEDLQGRDRSLLDETPLRDADPVRQLVELSHCRDFNEWWDRYFESGAMSLAAEVYFRNLLNWCLLLRDTNHDRIDAETRDRETFMARQINSGLTSGKRCLVVSGGFHTEALARCLRQPESTLAMPALSGERGVYLVPYSLNRLDAANDYGAGMPHTGYYQEVWQQARQQSRESHREAGKILALRVGRALAEGGESVTLPDCIEAVVLSQRLAALRTIPVGRPEILDAMETAFVKDTQEATPVHRAYCCLSQDLSRNKLRVSQTSEMVDDGFSMSRRSHHEHLFIANRATNAAVLPLAQRTRPTPLCRD